jgi:hypothetical protein
VFLVVGVEWDFKDAKELFKEVHVIDVLRAGGVSYKRNNNTRTSLLLKSIFSK